jgi:hypothetical protein
MKMKTEKKSIPMVTKVMLRTSLFFSKAKVCQEFELKNDK